MNAARNHVRGVTLVEVACAIMLIGLISAVFFRVYDRQVQVAMGDQKSSKYFQDLGLFFDTFQTDLAMAREIAPKPDGVVLVLCTESGIEEIRYSKKGSEIERSFRGKSKLFYFANPNPKDVPFFFQVEEVSP